MTSGPIRSPHTLLRVLLGLVVAAGLVSCRPAVGPSSAPTSPSASSAASSTRLDWLRLKTALHGRVERIVESHRLPVIDLESHYNETTFPLTGLAREMDAEGVAFMAMSPRWLPRDVERGGLDGWHACNRRLVAEGNEHFLPLTTASLHEFVRRPEALRPFLDAILETASREKYPMLGEFYFRRYPRNKDYYRARATPTTASSPGSARDPASRDFEIPIDGGLGEAIFAFAEQHDVPFQIHYEVEDRLLGPLERMLAAHPRARVVWCHAGRVRYPSRSTQYGAAYVGRLIARCPNLFFDISDVRFGIKYEGSGEMAQGLLDPRTGMLDAAWERVIVAHPDRFVSGLDLGVDRYVLFGRRIQAHRRLLEGLPPSVRERVAYRSAWRLLFGEEY